jgi:predicted DsbA family dithiol-disulfide isomerase
VYLRPRSTEFYANYHHSSYGGNVRQTINSHRLIHRTLAELGPEKQAALVERLFAGYFEQERDPADPDMLAGAAVAVGLFPGEAEARAYLAGTEDRAAVERDIALAQRKRISGVPFFEIEAGGVGAQISGAQDREVFVDVFDKIARKLRELGKLPTDGAKESGSDAQVDASARKTDNATC